METLTQGPMIEQTMITAGMDYYKPTMSQLQFEKHADKEVTFTFMNRGTQRLADYVTPEDLQSRFNQIRTIGWQEHELAFLGELKRTDETAVFSADFLEYLATSEMPEVTVCMDNERDDIAVEATGAWPLVTFWETIVMNEISEMYFANYVRTEGIDVEALYAQGDKNIDQWVAYLQANPDVKASEFGTRRRFSLRWQKHITERLADECPENLIGTSNVGLANTMNLRPVGTFAHEMPMVYAGIADAESGDIRASHNHMLRDWETQYGPELLTALSDTFTTDFFFEDFDKGQAQRWNGLRHDSGDPLKFAEKTINFYRQHDIDPRIKTIMFSDALDVNKVATIHAAVKGRINDRYGIGTNWTNNLGLKALNVVMKATHVQLPDGSEADTVKLSDTPGKHTGPEALVRRYGETIFNLTNERNHHERVLAVL